MPGQEGVREAVEEDLQQGERHKGRGTVVEGSCLHGNIDVSVAEGRSIEKV